MRAVKEMAPIATRPLECGIPATAKTKFLRRQRCKDGRATRIKESQGGSRRDFNKSCGL